VNKYRVCGVFHQEMKESTDMVRRVIQLLFFTVVLSTNAQTGNESFETVLIEGVPHILQKPDFCGEASAAMFLQKLGEDVDQDWVFDRSGLPPEAARGLQADELAATLARIGFDTGVIWKPLLREHDLDQEWTALYRDLASGIPSIVLMHTGPADGAEHFRLVLGYDGDADEVIYHEPAEPDGAYRRMDRNRFLELWPLQEAYEWGLVRIRLLPDKPIEAESSRTLTDADYAQHLMQLRATLPIGLSVEIEKPFVIVSDCQTEEIRDFQTRIVRQVVRLVKQDFFLRDPEKIVDIWMLKNAASYRFHSSSVFGIEPETPYGYFSPAHNAIILDISTGGGTLVHEMIHPFMAANFKQCPVWFNEGLASLFERPTTRSSHLEGLVNWRLYGLQEAIREQRTMSIETLLHLDENHFYGDARSLPYAQARYLCLFLQEKGQLVDFYHGFYESRVTDPDGRRTLMELLRTDDLSRFQKDFESWVMQLPAPDA
jgi:hypothetical protein